MTVFITLVGEAAKYVTMSIILGESRKRETKKLGGGTLTTFVCFGNMPMLLTYTYYCDFLFDYKR